MGVPCLTLRDTTERPETVSIGTNALIGTDPAKLAPALERLFAGDWQRGGIPALWDGRAGERIVAAIERVLGLSAEGRWRVDQEVDPVRMQESPGIHRQGGQSRRSG